MAGWSPPYGLVVWGLGKEIEDCFDGSCVEIAEGGFLGGGGFFDVGGFFEGIETRVDFGSVAVGEQEGDLGVEVFQGFSDVFGEIWEIAKEEDVFGFEIALGGAG